MKKVDFLFRYEHKVREIESLALIRLELERRGYSVEFLGNYEYDKNKNYKPRVFIAPAVYNNSQLWGEWKKYGAIRKIANMQWEQLFHIEEENKADAFHNITGVGQRIVNFCWGWSTKKRIDDGGCDKKKTIVVGAVNTDLLRDPFVKSLYTKDDLSAKYSLDKSKKWILFVSSFAHCEMEEFQASMSRQARGNDNFEMMTKIAYSSRDMILDWFEEVLKKDKTKIIIYRPHPDETGKYDRFKKLVSKYSNFKIIQDEAIKHWINVCDKTYTWYSTGVADAIILNNHPYRLLRPVELPESTDYRLMYSAKKIICENDFLNDLDDDSIIEVIPQNIFDEYFFIPKDFVYRRICDILEELYNTSKYDINYSHSEKINIFWLHTLYMFRIYVKKIFPSVIFNFIKELITSDRDKRYNKMLQDGYSKNVVCKDELDNILERLRPIIYNIK